MPVPIAEGISAAVTAVANLVQVIIQHADKSSEEIRRLNIQKSNQVLSDLSSYIDTLINRIKNKSSDED